jgi:murein L,D-transpeptidase YcbB/YkuD
MTGRNPAQDRAVPLKPSRVVHVIALLGLLLGTVVHAQQPAAEQPLGPVAEQIRERVEQWRGAHADADVIKTSGDAVAVFYEQTRFAPAWTRPGDLDQLLAALRDVAGDGLDPED